MPCSPRCGASGESGSQQRDRRADLRDRPVALRHGRSGQSPGFSGCRRPLGPVACVGDARRHRRRGACVLVGAATWSNTAWCIAAVAQPPADRRPTAMGQRAVRHRLGIGGAVPGAGTAGRGCTAAVQSGVCVGDVDRHAGCTCCIDGAPNLIRLADRTANRCNCIAGHRQCKPRPSLACIRTPSNAGLPMFAGFPRSRCAITAVLQQQPIGHPDRIGDAAAAR